MTFSTFDTHMMAIAIGMGERGLGRVAPNPSVGAVVADAAAGVVLGRGVTAPGGRPHAEKVALDRAGPDARGATLYVTLEPCCHQGRAGPCTEAILAAGIARVVFALADPDPRVALAGKARLRAAGVMVTCGLMAAEASALTAGHLLRVTDGRPHVTLKIACAADGSVPRGGEGAPAWVTPPLARAQGHLLRAMADAILVGPQTVLDDDPDLTCRLPGLAGRSPIRIVPCERMPPAGARLFATARTVPVWLMRERAGAATPADWAHIEALGVRVLDFAGGSCNPDRLLLTLLRRLGGEGVTRLLVEGGPRTWARFAHAGLADEVMLFQAGGPGDLGRAEPEAAIAQLLGPGAEFGRTVTRAYAGFTVTRFTANRSR